MTRNRMQVLRTLAATAVAVAAVACADRSSPTSPLDFATDASNRKADSAGCDLTVSGRLVRYTGVDTTAGDTTSRFEPVRGGKVELYLIVPLPDTIPDDTIPRDSVPRDSVPRDSVPRDSVPRDSAGGDSLFFRGLVLRGAQQRDTIGGGRDTTRGPGRRPDYSATSRGDGSFSIEGVCPGLYTIVYSEPGANGRSYTNTIIVERDVRGIYAVFPPRR